MVGYFLQTPLFALYINKISEQSTIDKKKEIAIERITKELYKNQAIIENWNKRHTATLNRIKNILNNEQDERRQKLLNSQHLDLSILTNHSSLVDAILTDVAWEAAKSTEIISELDYELVEKLTHVYTMQEHLMDKK